MARKKIPLNEFNADDLQSSVPDDGNNSPANNVRPADNAGNGDTAAQAFDTRLAFMGGILKVLRGMSPQQLDSLYQDMMPYVNGGGDNAVSHNRPAVNPNQATLNPGSAPSMPMPTLGESVEAVELQEILAETGLSEEFQKNAIAAFTVALQERELVAEAKLADAFDAKLEETKGELETQMKDVVAELSEGISDYLTLVTQKWFDENQLAIESGYKVQIGESILAGLRTLAEDHSISIKEENVDVVADLQKKVTELTESYNAVANELVAVKANNTTFLKEKVIVDASNGLTKTQVEKLKTLTESVEFTDAESFKIKVLEFKENYINQKTASKSSDVLNEATNDEDSDTPVLDERMALYVKAVSETPELKSKRK